MMTATITETHDDLNQLLIQLDLTNEDGQTTTTYPKDENELASILSNLNVIRTEYESI